MGQCLSEETLTDYLEGDLDPAVKAATEVHLLGCDNCRARLIFFMKLLRDEVTDEEARVLEVAQNEWLNRRPGRQLPHRRRSHRGWFLSMAAVAAGLIAGILLVPSIMEWGVTPRSATEIVDLLLAEQRPFESRISGQPYQPILRTRGAEAPGVDYGLLAGEMTERFADAYQMGRFYLLQKDFGRAVRYLEIAEQEAGAGPEVHNDLGVAYMESGAEIQLRRAGEEFRHSVSAAPEFAEGVFNLAIFYERTNNAAEARQQWERFLRLEPESPWADEARSKIQRNDQ